LSNDAGQGARLELRVIGNDNRDRRLLIALLHDDMTAAASDFRETFRR
jgi:hypothetical protein